MRKITDKDLEKIAEEAAQDQELLRDRAELDLTLAERLRLKND